ncbi:hypothetical protein RHGRI_037259 [Rhododendron griersonianum]|uniref:Uncharacterized protein n=1 Tax=Rhododendron griersonianum TaxID=479676 RepID=A0AAV6HTZ0_9ERIC|nr:hypothetical protein RHGRI_037259 [Rhododendron griersonianum]
MFSSLQKARMGAQQWSNAQDSLLGLENNNVASVVGIVSHFRPAECTKIWSFVSSCSAAVLGMSLSFVSNKSFAYLILRKWSSKWLIVLETCWTDILMFSVYNQEVYFYAINTNAQALLQSAAKKPLQIGELFTRGLALWWESTLGRTSCGGIKGTDCWRCIEFNFSGLPPLSYVMVW